MDDDDPGNETRHIKKQNEAMNLAFKLDEKISYIDELYQTQMQLHEQDFLTAYKGHITHIMKEVKSLKEQLNEKNFDIKKDEKVKKLSGCVDEFKDIAMGMKKDLNKNKEINKEFKEKNSGLEEEKWALE